jgi:hypothetical protein
MSIKSKLFASAATLTLVGGVATAATLTAATASAETPSCGPTCVDFFNLGPGSTYESPSYLLDSYKQGEATGTPAILFPTNNTDPAQDFQISSPEPVSDYFQAGLVGSAVALHYGCNPGEDFDQCTGTGGIGVNDYAFEIQYTPFGAPTGECIGVAATATQGEHVTLQPCGVSGKTLWILDTPCFASVTATEGGGSGSPGNPGNSPGNHCGKESTTNPSPTTFYAFATDHTFPLINGSDTNFDEPYVLTYPNGASPTSMPRPVLETEELTVFANSYGFPESNVNFNPESTARNDSIKPPDAGSLVMNGTYGAHVAGSRRALPRLR